MARSEFERMATVRRLASNGDARRLRQDADLSLNDIATEVGVLPGSVWKWETGRARPTGEPALRYLKVLERLAALAGAAA